MIAAGPAVELDGQSDCGEEACHSQNRPGCVQPPHVTPLDRLLPEPVFRGLPGSGDRHASPIQAAVGFVDGFQRGVFSDRREAQQLRQTPPQFRIGQRIGAPRAEAIHERVFQAASGLRRGLVVREPRFRGCLDLKHPGRGHVRRGRDLAEGQNDGERNVASQSRVHGRCTFAVES